MSWLSVPLSNIAIEVPILLFGTPLAGTCLSLGTKRGMNMFLFCNGAKMVGKKSTKNKGDLKMMKKMTMKKNKALGRHAHTAPGAKKKMMKRKSPKKAMGKAKLAHTPAAHKPVKHVAVKAKHAAKRVGAHRRIPKKMRKVELEARQIAPMQHNTDQQKNPSYSIVETAKRAIQQGIEKAKDLGLPVKQMRIPRSRAPIHHHTQRHK